MLIPFARRRRLSPLLPNELSRITPFESCYFEPSDNTKQSLTDNLKANYGDEWTDGQYAEYALLLKKLSCNCTHQTNTCPHLYAFYVCSIFGLYIGAQGYV